jgi:dTDP-4-amino-4,6-dideoxygalactose transaminase
MGLADERLPPKAPRTHGPSASRPVRASRRVTSTPRDDERAVPFVDLRSQTESLGDALRDAVVRVVDSGVYVLGEEVASFEAAAARYLGVRHAVGVSSGSDALLMALVASGIGRGDEVITSPFSFFATAESIIRSGAVPRFVDIDPETLNLDVGQVESAIGARTRAVLPVHLFGVPADVERLDSICRARGLALVEDAAQAFGSRARGRPVGTGGASGCFSFFPTKVLGALGDGGLVVTNDDVIAERCRRLREHGAARRGEHVELGGNYRLDALQAAVLSAKLARVDEWITSRRRHAAAYDAAFSGLEGVEVPRRGPLEDWNSAVYTIRVRHGRRDELRERLRERRVETAVYYERALHFQPALSFLGNRAGSFPDAEKATAEVLSLPVFPEMTDAQLEWVIDGVRDFFA